MVSIETCDGTLRLPDDMVRALVRYGEQQAEMTAACLDATGLFPSKPSRLPAGYLLELGAVLQLGLWERQDLCRHLDVDLPTYREAANQLAARAMKGPAEFQGGDAAPLSRQVNRVWMEHFAWNGPELLQAEVVVGGLDEDQFIDVLAEFVWNHHRELKHLALGDVQK